ncbi:related to N-acetylglucosamine-6-phosphate deacetylase (NagA), putative [Saccharomycodes ludwigii]|uniref:N-acetylglucosamine-6-phosphate deacetylase n=1 Tax=Saccharomycodes ludwigii TaxID=36035 RepID=A0A376B9L5_9ASCO|nr:conserved putative N-acetylglucosamine-6-phosphate deacetylase [Saccharomycodes ludwigii]KAH3898653.1 conserved putative N-acetylglucosamine-6-phosphate deacetylase [Saccharomycodes ludwigii]SSD61311.1 related to N-acetylglucosamine-6-phosphate deacetylase (NagA), putative [Saccharomycodes ludwigii]
MTYKKNILHFTNCFVADKGILSNRDLWVDVENGIIIDKPQITDDYIEVNLEGKIIVAGFMDIQINGCFGLDYSTVFDCVSEKEQFIQEYNNTMQKMVQYGVTSICPTVTSSFSDVYKDVLPIVGSKTRSSERTDSLGAHLEGPFISRQKKGCHPPETLDTMQAGYKSVLMRYGSNFADYTAIITAAPEVQNVIQTMKDVLDKHPNIVYSIGHTMSDFDTGVQAIESGGTMMTHLFNAMPPFTARNPGVIGLIDLPNTYKNIDTPYYGLVADGIHVHPSAIKLAYNLNPDKAILVTDAMSLIGLPDGSYIRGTSKNQEQQKIVKIGHRLLLQNTETIAGSATHLLDCVKNLMKWTGVPLEKALVTITNNPSKSLNLQASKGFLDIGCDADLVILDSNTDISMVYKLGHKVL